MRNCGRSCHLAWSSISLLLCMAATTASSQTRRTTRTHPGAPTPTTLTPSAPTLAAFALPLDSLSGEPGTQPNGQVTLSAAAPAGEDSTKAAGRGAAKEAAHQKALGGCRRRKKP